MSDYLTKRAGYWHFVRRVPLEYAHLDPRGIIKHSTKMLVAKDRRGVKAGRVADAMNRELEAFWRGLEDGKAEEAAARYAEARRRARAFGYDYVETADLANRSDAELLERLEKLVSTRTIGDPRAAAALLGTEKRPAVKLSEVFSRYQAQTRNEVKDMSPNQLKRWQNGYVLAITDLISVIGDKALDAISHADVLDYVDWMEGRVEEGEIVAKTANKYIGHNSKMLKEINRRLRLGLPDFFAGMRLQGQKNVSRPPFPIDYVQKVLLGDGALMELNDEARRAVFLIADSGLRLSEAVNLNADTIQLDGDIPYVRVMPDGRRVKTDQSIREVPLVGVALAAMKLQPGGFPRYVDKGASFSGYVNQFLAEKGLRPTPKHSVYSLRHTFEDRLKEAKAQDSMIDELMGHSDGKNYRYGKGHPLRLKHELLKSIAYKSPSAL